MLGKRSSPPTDSTTQLLRPEATPSDGNGDGTEHTSGRLDDLLGRARTLVEGDARAQGSVNGPKGSLIELLKRLGDGEESEEFEQVLGREDVLEPGSEGSEGKLRLHDGQGAGALYKLLEKTLINLKRRN